MMEVSHTSDVSGASKSMLWDVFILAVGERVIDEVGDGRGDDHHDAHHEDPDQQLYLHQRIVHRQQDKGDQRDARHAVGFESVRARAHRIARVVAGAIGDNARVARVVFLDLEDNLHQIRADIGDLGEDAARHAQGSRAQRFADRESDEARSRIIARHEQAK